MNGLVIVLIAIVLLAAGYLLYGRWLAKKWGIDPKAETPAVKYEDGEDFVPSSRFTVFSHQFSSIAGAGPVTGPILASVFGWVPVFLWIVVGGLFFGAVQDFGALYASVKNEGKSMGMIIEKYIGKMGRKLFMLFCWLFTLLVIAAFTDMVAGTFNAYPAGDGNAVYANGAAATVSMLFIGVAVILGIILKKAPKMNEIVKGIVAIALIVVMFAVGMKLPIYTNKTMWIYIIMIYLFLASVLPMWLLMQPRDYMTTFMLLGMIIGAVVGVVVAHPAMQLNAFNGFVLTGADGSKSYLFPTLFVTIACGAVSGFHSLVSSETSSKTIRNEKDMPMVGYGAMVVESLLGIIVLVVVGAVAVNGTKPDGTPFAIFSSGVAGFLEMLGVPNDVATVFMTMCVSALALTSLDAVSRIGRMSFQELFSDDDMEHAEGWRKLLCNTYFSTIVTLLCAYVLTRIGYANIWPLFGSANQLLSALVLVTLCVFMKVTGRSNKMLFAPLIIMLCVTGTALVERTIGLVKAYAAGSATFLVEGLQLIIAVLLMALGLVIVINSLKAYFGAKKESEA